MLLSKQFKNKSLVMLSIYILNVGNCILCVFAILMKSMIFITNIFYSEEEDHKINTQIILIKVIGTPAPLILDIKFFL